VDSLKYLLYRALSSTGWIMRLTDRIISHKKDYKTASAWLHAIQLVHERGLYWNRDVQGNSPI